MGAVPLHDLMYDPESSEHDVGHGDQEETEEEEEEVEPEEDHPEADEEGEGSKESTDSSSSSGSCSDSDEASSGHEPDNDVGGHEPRAPRRQDCPRLHLCDVGRSESYMRLSQMIGNTWEDIRGVCARHGCTMSRSCRTNRPIGEVWAWLKYGCSPQCDTKQKHVDYVPDLTAKRKARKDVLAKMPESRPWFEAEMDSDTKPFAFEPGEETLVGS